MRRLFATIFLWFWLTLLAVALVLVFVFARAGFGYRALLRLSLHDLLLFSLAGAAVLYLADQPKLFCPLMALTSGFGFAMMGVVFYRRFFYVAAVYLAAAVVCPWVGPVRQWSE